MQFTITELEHGQYRATTTIDSLSVDVLMFRGAHGNDLFHCSSVRVDEEIYMPGDKEWSNALTKMVLEAAKTVRAHAIQEEHDKITHRQQLVRRLGAALS